MSTMFPTNMKIRQGSLNFRATKFEGFMVEPSDVRIFFISIKSLVNHHICMFYKICLNLVGCEE